MRGFPVLAVVLLVTVAACPAAADFPAPLTVVLWATPDGAGVNETVTLHVEVYSHASLVQPDSIEGAASAGFYRDLPTYSLDLTPVGVGKYTAPLTIRPEFNSGYRSVQVMVYAELGESGETGLFAYPIGAPGVPSGLYIGATVANRDTLGYEPLPGSWIVFQAHTHRDGVPDDTGVPSGRVVVFPYQDRLAAEVPPFLPADEVAVQGVRVAPGVYNYSFQVPPATDVSTRFEFHADVDGTVLQPRAVAHVVVHPVPAILEIVNGTPAATAARVCASYRAHAVHGASVTFGLVPGFGRIWPEPRPVVVNQTTGPEGCASVPLDPDGTSTEGIGVIAQVRAFGATTHLLANGAYYNDPFEPQGNLDPPPHDLVITLLSDPTAAAAGEVTTFVLRATVSGEPLAGSRIAVLAGPWYEGRPFYVGERPTDGNGAFSFDCPIPEGWTWGDILRVRFVTAAGERVEAHLHIGPPPKNVGVYPAEADPGPSRLVVTNDTANRTVTVRVVPPPGTDAAGVTLWVDIYPAESLFPHGSVTRDGSLPSGELRWDGEAFAGTIALPAWLWEGEYVVAVHQHSAYGFRTRSDDLQLQSWRTVHLEPAHGAPPPVDGTRPEPPEALRPPAEPGRAAPGGLPPEVLGEAFPYLWLVLMVAAGSLSVKWLRRRPRDEG